MRRKGTIILVDDDPDDVFILEQVFDDLGIRNARKSFADAQSCLDFLHSGREEILIILSDINMPGLSGIDFKEKINDDPVLAGRNIPFVFYSTTTAPQTVKEAFERLQVNGFFVKNPVYAEVKLLMNSILDYWNKTSYIDCTG